MTLPPSLAAACAQPPRAYSPVAIWWWSGEPLERARLRWQLERFVAGGVYQLVILNLAPSGPLFGADPDDPAFFSDAWWALLDDVCTDAAELGASLWFYDQLGFSGAEIQARLVEERPEYAGRWLERDPGTGEIREVVRGFDYLSTPACASLIDRVHGEFERRLGHRLGTVLVGSFQDELPALPSWSATFREEFIERRGYDLEPVLGALWDDDAPNGHRIRRDYHRTRAELAEEAFFRPLADWHRRHGLLSGCDQQDPARAGHPVDGVRLYADYARTHRWFSAPGSDHHGDARIHSSLAHLYGHPRTWIEAFHSTGWGGTLEETFDWLLPWLRAGANLYNPHAVYYTTKAGWWEWAPPSTDWRQPYWAHHRVFADAVTRLCAALSLGRHVCDIAVLLPTTTAQAGSRLDGAGAAARLAQQTYLDLVGDMTWFHTVPGALDRLHRDADVIDDDSVARSTVEGGRLRVAGEAYAAVILPACTVLEGATARRLDEFVAAGGLVVAVAALPVHGVGDAATRVDDGAAVARLRERFTSGAAAFVDTSEDLGPVLEVLPRAVEAPVHTLVREVDGARVVFVAAASSRASEVSVGQPGERGVALGWLDATYEFDPGRYQRAMPVRVRDVAPVALLVDPFTADVRSLRCSVDGDSVEVIVPFDNGPAALLVFPPPADNPTADGPTRASASRRTAPTGPEFDLGERWQMELVPTLDNTWGDFARGSAGGSTIERWAMRHRLDGDERWSAAHATFGPHGEWSLASDPRRTRHVEYSDSRGIRKDPIHRETLGPKGHVPEEFLRFGLVCAGQTVQLRSDLIVPDGLGGSGGWLAIGAAAAKSVQVAGVTLPLRDHGYLAIAPLRLPPGRYPLHVHLTPDEALDLRAYIAVVRDPDRFRRPEWIAAGGAGRPGSRVVLGTAVELPEVPERGRLLLAALVPSVVRVNGVDIGQQGGFEPYAEQEIPRVRRYELASALRPGVNELSVELVEGHVSGAVLVDAEIHVRTADVLCVSSDRSWWARRDGVATPIRVLRRQYGDPAALHLRRRAHPLPATAWLEHTGADDDVVPVVLALPRRPPADRVQWLAFAVPPGARRLHLDVRGEVTVFVDGVERAVSPGRDASTAGSVAAHTGCAPVRVTVELADEPLGPRECALRIHTKPGYEHGAALAGPAVFEVGTGVIALGDWERVGLAEYSGGVRYRQGLHLAAAPAAALLDLGRVRGTAEVTVNRRPAGVRVCAPYTFDVGGALRPGENDVEIVVYGTLAPYLDAVSPTHFVFPGQRVSGLFGPVRLRTAPTARGDHVSPTGDTGLVDDGLR